MIPHLLIVLSMILGSAASSELDVRKDELLLNLSAEPNSVVLASEPQNRAGEFGFVATRPLYAVESKEAPLIQGNNDECPYDPTQSSRKMRSKRESHICYPPTRNSPLSVQGSDQNPSKDPQDNARTTRNDSQNNAQPNRNSAPPVKINCAAIPSAPTPVCAVVSEDYIRLDLVYPTSDRSAGWWQLEYSRTAPPACYHEVGEILFCCALVFPNGNNLRYPILRAQYPLTAVSCLPMEDMNLPSEAPPP